MPRIFSGIQPSGDLHVGNYLGAVRQWVAGQHVADAVYCIVDLHALTLDIDPAALRGRTFDTAIGLLASGVDPTLCTLFVQSHVPAHTELAWLLECTASFGELRRMTQFKEKGADQESVRASLLTYPVLMAADILLYDTDQVPVGDDQRQHLELARDLAIRFNSRYGDTFVVPDATLPSHAARVMDLQRPERKMSKSTGTPLGTIAITDSPDEIVKKVRRAVTDTDSEVAYDIASKPGVSNLLEMLAAATGERPEVLATRYDAYGPLKSDVADALVELLAPVRERIAELSRDVDAVAAVLANGATKATRIAAPTLDRARGAVGLTPRAT
ncbi:MAG TPA: tryptophan--tRNA ligase [Acidimicrobiales bacterium]|nr:tryptophan--tRNA ligase [Acidimicrobiales bacterium]